MTARRGLTLQDVRRPVERRTLRQLPRLILAGIQLLWSAAPREFAQVCGLQVLAGAAIGSQVVLARELLATILSTGTDQDAVPMFALLGALGITTLVTSFANSVQPDFQRLIAELVSRHVTSRVFDIVAAADLERFDTPEFHDRLQRAWVNGLSRPMEMTQGISAVIGSAASMLGIGVGLAATLPVLIPLLLLGAFPVLYLTTRSSRDLHEFSWGITALDRRRAYLSRVITHRQYAHEVIAFGLVRFLSGRWRALQDERLLQLHRLVRRRIGRAALASLGLASLLVLPAGLVSFLLVTGRLGLPEAAAAAGGVLLLRPALHSLVAGATQLYECALFLDDYDHFLRTSLEPCLRERASDPPLGFSKITVECASFTYREAETAALEDISLEIRAGEVIALVGENGSGKTTLAKLLSGLYRPRSGHIRWDGRNVDDLPTSAHRRSVAVLFQDFVQYFLTVRENIGVGRPEQLAEPGAVEDAAERAGAAAFIRNLAAGYETLLGPEFEGGQNLSVGQWQRVALARAFLRDTPLVILDEPTAALDARAEHELFASIRELFRGRTVLLITHRLTSVRSADRIYVLKAGRLVEAGTHDELVRRDGLYAELYRLQAHAFADPVAISSPPH